MPAREQLPEALKGLERLSVSIAERPSPGVLYAASIDPDPEGEFLRVEDVAAALLDQDGEVVVRLILDELRAEIHRQDEKHGPYERQSRLGVSRLALATMEDEVREALDAWRSERKAPAWTETRAEVLQVAAVAVRTIRDALNQEED